LHDEGIEDAAICGEVFAAESPIVIISGSSSSG
jgi:hypothetical protein